LIIVFVLDIFASLVICFCSVVIVILLIIFHQQKTTTTNSPDISPLFLSVV